VSRVTEVSRANIEKIKDNFENIKTNIENIRHIKIPKSITLILLRIILVIPIYLLIQSSRLYVAVGFFIGTILIGYFDLYFQKKKHIGLQLISILDPFADKLLIIFASFALWQLNKLSLLVFSIYAAKDIIMIIGGIVLLKKNKKTIFKRNNLDKWTVFFQSIALTLIMIGARDLYIIWISLGLTVVSGIYSIFRSGVIKSKKKVDLERFSLGALIKVPDYITFANVMSGLFSIVLAINGSYNLAMLMLIIAVIADYFDGKVANAIEPSIVLGRREKAKTVGATPNEIVSARLSSSFPK
jgi:phosphatidylglycerophosphate synthase